MSTWFKGKACLMVAARNAGLLAWDEGHRKPKTFPYTWQDRTRSPLRADQPIWHSSYLSLPLHDRFDAPNPHRAASPHQPHFRFHTDNRGFDLRISGLDGFVLGGKYPSRPRSTARSAALASIGSLTLRRGGLPFRQMGSFVDFAMPDHLPAERSGGDGAWNHPWPRKDEG
jgi:hypothetical protein